MRFFGSSASNSDNTVGLVYGKSTMNCKLIFTKKLTTPESKSTMEADELAAKENAYQDGLFNDEAELHAVSVDDHSTPKEYFETKSLAVPAQQDMWIATGVQSASTSSEADASEVHLKPSQKLYHQRTRRNRMRNAEEKAVRQRNKRNHRRLRGKKVGHKIAKLKLEDQAMRAFPGIPVQKAMEAYDRREQARAARALEPHFIFAEQRLVMVEFEAEQQLDHSEEDQLEHEGELAGWMVDGGFGGGFGGDVDAGGDDDDFVMMDGFEDQDNFGLAWMDGEAAFTRSSLALTPPHH